MALLQLLSEENLGDESVAGYFDDLYRIVSVSEREGAEAEQSSVIRSTYLVDWEQLVYLLEDCSRLGEDIVEVTPVGGEAARAMRRTLSNAVKLARA